MLAAARNFWPLGDGIRAVVRDAVDAIEPRHRPIALAVSISLIAHMALLGIDRSMPSSFDDRSLVTDLRLWIEQPSDRDIVAPEVADVRRQSAPEAGSPEVAAATMPDPTDATSLSADATTPATASSAPADPSAATATIAESPNGEASATQTQVATTVASQNAEPAAPSDRVQTEPSSEMPIPSAERSMVTRAIQRWSGNIPDGSLQGQELSWQHQQVQYTARVQRLVSAGSMGLERVIVEVRTERDGVQYTSHAQLRRLAFSNFSQYVDQWDKDVQLHDDTIDGRFHSNSEIVVGWDGRIAPRLLGRVTTAARHYATGETWGNKQRNQIFSGGIELGTPRISLPRGANRLADGQTAGDVETLTILHDARISFHGDGGYDWSELRDAGLSGHGAAALRPLQIIAAKGARLQVQGTIGGRVLVYSPTGIIITGSLVYAHDARAGDESPDFLGLVSDRDVVIATRRVTGPGDLKIDAAVYARDRFVVTDLMTNDRATLSIFGSLSAGSISASEPRYATRIKYDQRFERTRPPGYPMANSYEVESWDGHWSRD